MLPKPPYNTIVSARLRPMGPHFYADVAGTGCRHLDLVDLQPIETVQGMYARHFWHLVPPE